jgi:hypothetical protein
MFTRFGQGHGTAGRNEAFEGDKASEGYGARTWSYATEHGSELERASRSGDHILVISIMISWRSAAYNGMQDATNDFAFTCTVHFSSPRRSGGCLFVEINPCCLLSIDVISSQLHPAWDLRLGCGLRLCSVARCRCLWRCSWFLHGEYSTKLLPA